CETFRAIELDDNRMVGQMVERRSHPQAEEARPVQDGRLYSGENGMTQMTTAAEAAMRSAARPGKPTAPGPGQLEAIWRASLRPSLATPEGLRFELYKSNTLWIQAAKLRVKRNFLLGRTLWHWR